MRSWRWDSGMPLEALWGERDLAAPTWSVSRCSALGCVLMEPGNVTVRLDFPGSRKVSPINFCGFVCVCEFTQCVIINFSNGKWTEILILVLFFIYFVYQGSQKIEPLSCFLTSEICFQLPLLLPVTFSSAFCSNPPVEGMIVASRYCYHTQFVI